MVKLTFELIVFGLCDALFIMFFSNADTGLP